MRLSVLIIATLIGLTSCSKQEVLPEDIIIFEIEKQKIEHKLNRFSKVKFGLSDLYLNTYGFKIDSLTYDNTVHIAYFDLKTVVAYHTDSNRYINEISSIVIDLVNKSDSSIINYSSEICDPKDFELIIYQVELKDEETGFYSGRFHGGLCDSSKSRKLNIVNGEIVRARL